MRKLNRGMCCVLAGVLSVAAIGGCGKNAGNIAVNQEASGGEKLNVVATIFPEYDFLRAIAGDKINLTMLLTPGAESHSFEPTPKDIIEVNEADVFVYVGGDSDSWVESILDSVDTESMDIITLMDCVDLVEEEVVEGMTAEEEHDHEEETEESHEEEEEVEYDEHVWTSPKNTKLIVQKLSDALCEADPDNAETYQTNTESYLTKLDALDQKFQDVVDQATRTEIIVGDRFPFRYFVDAYGLTYYAAFPG